MLCLVFCEASILLDKNCRAIIIEIHQINSKKKLIKHSVTQLWNQENYLLCLTLLKVSFSIISNNS